MSLAVHPLGEIMKITGTAILRDYHRANDFQVAAEVTDSGVLKKTQKGVVPDLGRINIDQPYLTNKKGRLDPSKLALLLFRRPIADSYIDIFTTSRKSLQRSDPRRITD